MTPETIVTILVAVGGATWALRSKLGDIEKALSAHVASDTAQFTAIRAALRKKGRKQQSC